MPERIRQKINTKKIITIVFLGFIALSIPIFISQINKRQDSRQFASTIPLPLEMKVLVLEYYPRDPADPTLLDYAETDITSTVAEKESYVNSLITDHIAFLTEATKYKGYKNPSAPSYLSYTVHDRKKYYSKIPQGYQLSWTTAKRPHYGQIMNSVDICDYVNNQGVKEVWMFGYHSGIIEPDESRMASKYGDVSNSNPRENYPGYEPYKMPVCNKAYTLWNFHYGRANEQMAHNVLHQIENAIPFAENAWPPSPANIPGSTFWGDFSELVDSSTVHNYNSSCGNAHYPPNWRTPEDNYLYDISSSRQSNCETWNPDDTKTTYSSNSCTQWGCTEIGFYKWFLQNIPGYNNCIEHNGEYMRNWWDAMYDFDAFIDAGRSLYQNTPHCIPATPTPTPTITPSPTPTPTGTAPTPTPTGTTTPSITLNVSFTVDGIGNTGGSINSQPLHTTRQTTLQIFDTSNNLLITKDGDATYNNASGTFKGSFEIPENTASPFHIKAHFENTLINITQTPISILTGTRSYTIPNMFLISGDLDTNNVMNIQDYSNMIACIRNEPLCTSNLKIRADLNDNGKHYADDLNILLKAFLTPTGKILD